MIISNCNCAATDTTERYRLLRTLSKSHKSQVHLIESIKDKSLHICKLQKTTPDLYSLAQREKFLNQAELIGKFSHKNIIEIEVLCDQGLYSKSSSHLHECIFYLTEYHSQGNLLSLVMNNSNGLDDVYTKIIFKQMVSSLSYMQSLGFAHGDVRLENFLMSNNGLIKLIDFEYSKPANDLCTIYEGSNYYMAPEILRESEYMPGKSDVFSLGCVLFSLYFGHPGFNTASLKDNLYSNLINKPEIYWRKVEARKEVPYDLKFLLENMLAYEPNDRLSMEEILRSCWMC